MHIWPGLLVAPLLALADQLIAYAAIGWACNHTHDSAVHLVHALFLAAAVACTLAAWPVWKRARSGRTVNEVPAQQRFLAGLALVLGAFSVVVIAAMWMPTWVIAPCIS
jgi:hypothetical protein